MVKAKWGEGGVGWGWGEEADGFSLSKLRNQFFLAAFLSEIITVTSTWEHDIGLLLSQTRHSQRPI